MNPLRQLEQLLQPNRARPRPTQTVIEREVAGFQTHRDHLHYQSMERRGAPRGSGAVESLGV